MTDFDEYARSYEAIHAENVARSGESPSYFAAYKQRILERMLGRNFERPVLDFGCGIGALTELLSRSFREVDGYDDAAESLRVARTRAPGARFFERGTLRRRDAGQRAPPCATRGSPSSRPP